MTRDEARVILGEWLDAQGNLHTTAWGAAVIWQQGEAEVQLDGYFTGQQLHAIAVWVTPETPGETLREVPHAHP